MKAMMFLVLSYILGSIPSAFVVTKIITGRDIRKIGSGNVGTMNTLRHVGLIPGIMTFLIDFSKGALATWAALSSTQSYFIVYASAMFVMIGHNWPLLLRFKGGKGLAATAGSLAVINIKICVIVYTVIGITSLLLKNTDRASIIGFLVYPFLLLLIYNNFQIFIIGLVHFSLVLIRHYPGLKKGKMLIT